MSSEAKFTPGPWRIRSGRSGVKSDISCEDRPDTLATTAFHGWTTNELEANARLIAAAPEMFEALKITMDSVAILATGRCPADLVQERIALLEQARAAIAKAKGAPDARKI